MTHFLSFRSSTLPFVNFFVIIKYLYPVPSPILLKYIKSLTKIYHTFVTHANIHPTKAAFFFRLREIESF